VSLYRIAIAEAEPGMILAQPVCCGQGSVLVQPDAVLDERLLSLLTIRGVTHVHVRGGRADLDPGPDEPFQAEAIEQREDVRFGPVGDDAIMQSLRDATIPLKIRRYTSWMLLAPRPVKPPSLPRPPDREEVIEMAKSTRVLPTLPAIHAGVAAITDDPNSSAVDVANVIESDPAFAAALLRVANSALYRRSEPVTTIARAVSLLGHKGIRELCLTTSVLDVMSWGARESRLTDGFWRHAIATAAAARVLGSHLETAGPEECFLAGLLHDLGALFWLHHAPQTWEAVATAAESLGLTLLESESRWLGVTHERLGRLMIQSWRLPVRFVEVIGYHHRPHQATAAPLLCHAVHVADVMAQALELGGPLLARVPKIEEASWRALGRTTEEWPELLEHTLDRFQQVEYSLAGVLQRTSGAS
jgi:HD-like signal output (HDOD) protein